jgi:hypothetical protein
VNEQANPGDALADTANKNALPVRQLPDGRAFEIIRNIRRRFA